MKKEAKGPSNKMMTVEEHNNFTKALMEKNRKANEGKPPKPPIKPANYTPRAKPANGSTKKK